jgi:hypothetical protein
MADFSASYETLQEVSNTADTIADTLTAVDIIAHVICAALTAAAAYGCVPCPKGAFYYESEISPTVREIISVCEEIHTFMDQAINVIKVSEEVASGRFDSLENEMGAIAQKEIEKSLTEEAA